MVPSWPSLPIARVENLFTSAEPATLILVIPTLNAEKGRNLLLIFIRFRGPQALKGQITRSPDHGDHPISFDKIPSGAP
jgi:hypothetical protein